MRRLGQTMKSVKGERRVAQRADIEPIEISNFTSLDHMTLLTRHGFIVDASATGFLIQISRSDLVPKEFKDRLSIEDLTGDRVMLKLKDMDLELSGTVTRTKRLKKDLFEIGIDYSDDAPEYWRECLLELLPKPGEFH